MRNAARREISATARRWRFRAAPDLLAGFASGRPPDVDARGGRGLKLSLSDGSLARSVSWYWRRGARCAAFGPSDAHNAPRARLLYDTVDAIWHGVGDHATDFSFYTAREFADLCRRDCIGSDRSPDFADTQEFIERRLLDLHRLSGLRERLASAAQRLPDPLRQLRPSR